MLVILSVSEGYLTILTYLLEDSVDQHHMTHLRYPCGHLGEHLRPTRPGISQSNRQPDLLCPWTIQKHSFVGKSIWEPRQHEIFPDQI